MSGGGDASHDIAGLAAHVASASADLESRNGLVRLMQKNSSELTSRASGAIAAVLLVISAVSLLTEYAISVVSVCGLVAIALAGNVWLKHWRLRQLQETQARGFAQGNTQEDRHA